MTTPSQHGSAPDLQQVQGPRVQRAVAGAGKTHWLVERYVSLVVDADPPADPASVVVITFTEAAARELIDRVRRRLTDIADTADGSASGGAPRSERARRALTALAAAPIGTIHAFARRILMQHAAEVGIPYGVDVLDDVDPATQQLMARRIRSRIVEQAARRGLAVQSLSRANHNLIDDAVALLPDVSTALLCHPEWADPNPEIIAAAEHQAWQEVAEALGPQPGILFVQDAVASLADYLTAVDAAAASADFAKRQQHATDILSTLQSLPADAQVDGTLKLGRLSWLTKPMRATCAKLGLGAAIAAADTFDGHNAAIKERDARRATALVRLAGIHAVEAFVWERHHGSADWLLQDELLRRSFCLVRDRPEIGTGLRDSYPHVLLDEAQDIDATQRQFLLAFTGATGLTVVGDPQQSIYGFRGADHGTFDELQRELLGDDAPEHLTTTRRSLPLIVDAVNAVFGSDPAHTPMAAHRGDPDRGSVTVLTAAEAAAATSDQANDTKPDAGDFRIAQADAIADVVAHFLHDDEAQVWDRLTGAWRAVRASDVAILVASRTPVPDIAEALRRRGVAALVRTSRDMARHPVAEGLAASLLAVSQPADTRALLLALRSPVFALTDEEITRHCLVHGRLRLWHDGEARSGVAEALATLREAATVMRAHGPGRAAALVINRQSLLAVLAGDGDYGWQDGWSQVRLLVDSVTDYWLTHGGSAANFAAWLRGELAAAGSTNRSVLNEPDATSVTITTIHQAKGLQWPVVVVAAESGDEPSAPRLSFGADDIYTRMGAQAAYVPVHTDAAEVPPERARRHYVALTRACDHLVISTVGKPRGAVPDSMKPDLILTRLSDALGDRLRTREVAVQAGQRLNDAGPSTTGDAFGVVGLLTGNRWAITSDVITNRLAAVAASSARTLRRESPSDAGHAADTQPAQPPHSTDDRSRSGPTLSPQQARDFGTSVHSVLEAVDLTTFTDLRVPLDEVVNTCGPAIAVLTSDPDIRRVVETARNAEVLRRAAAAAVCRREMPVSGHAMDGEVEVIFEGIVDMLFAEDHDGRRRWTLVDYKTDGTARSDADFLALYAPQLRTYERLLAACGIETSEKVLLRLQPSGVSEVRVP